MLPGRKGRSGRDQGRPCLKSLLRCLEFTFQSSVFHGYVPHLTQESRRRQASWDLPHLGEAPANRSPLHRAPCPATGCKAMITAQPRRSPSPPPVSSPQHNLACGSKDAIPTYLFLGSQTCFFPFSRKFYSRREGWNNLYLAQIQRT